jgi:hypothetical protein
MSPSVATTPSLGQKQIGENFVLLGSRSRTDRRIGLYAKGSCDLNSIFACAPLIEERLEGTCCILKDGLVADSRSDMHLQTLQALPRDATRQVVRRFRLAEDYFRPVLFEPTFTVPTADGPQEFPKSVILLSIAPDVVRNGYRHKEYGLIVDPGGSWLNQSLDTVLADLSMVASFRESFVPIGKISLDDFAANFTKLIALLKDRTGAHVLVYNTLTVEPGSRIHNLQLVKNFPPQRRREFVVALAELSRALDFSIVDVDRISKRFGIQAQVDFGHLPAELSLLIAREVVRIIRDLGVLP